jgi:hypothetical protein
MNSRLLANAVKKANYPPKANELTPSSKLFTKYFLLDNLQ